MQLIDIHIRKKSENWILTLTSDKITIREF